MPKPLAYLHLPSSALSGCLMAGVERDTRACELADLERFNYYPATPMVVISWVFAGTLHMVEQPQPAGEPLLSPALPNLILSGPQRKPSASWSPGPIHALSVGFYPEILSYLLGQPVAAFVDRHVALDSVAPPALLLAFQSLLTHPGRPPFARLEAKLARLWQKPGRSRPSLYVGDWLRSLATRAAHSAAGASVRQLQRRMRDWTGQSQRDLQLFSRVETAFLHRLHQASGPEASLAAAAAEAGYADQSHMGREIRRVTGLSPARFEERMATDEAFWYYRLIASALRPQADPPRKLAKG
ncbi:MAG: helix-turn-helix domain-containing protein [Azonexus sp.]|nr:helix-turn-helix domain-containing protein [Azonexus sp.]MCK6413662.1 helix-turn-helix domain-containing protein [Azonexus sp.]